jgi:hypothetical protein
MFSTGFLVVPFSAAALVLAASGLAKLRRPGSLVRMLGAVGVPAGPTIVRCFAVFEMALGSMALLLSRGDIALALAVVYVMFAGFLSWLLLRGIRVPSCGCAGELDVPPSWIHVALNVGAAAAALGAAATGPTLEGIFTTASRLPLAGVALIAGVAVIAWLAALSAAYLPTVLFAYRGRA